MNRTRTLLLGAALLAAPSALAQQHGDHGNAPQTEAMDHSQMDHGAMDHEAMMALHMRMMADPEIHAAMRADPEMQAMMAEIMPQMDHGGMDHDAMQGMDHGQMDGMDHEMPMDADAQAAMMARMRERMQAMSPAEHAAMMTRMEAAHHRLMASPAVHQRMMADPEMRQMMEAMPGMEDMDHGQMDGMDHGAMPEMDHSGMNHGAAAEPAMQGMDHSQMSGMDHGGMDHTEGVAQQRRNAGAQTGDEREQASSVGPAAFDASATADRFHAALASGDRAAMEALLAPDAVVLEGGAHESRAEYLSHHFARDAEFLSGTTPESLYRRTGVAGDAAWVASTQRVGDTEMAELLVMKQTPDGWRVAAVHWSSAR